MKKFIIIVIMAACSLLAMAQEQGEKKLILKNGTTLTGIVEVQIDGSYQLKTATGDILYFAPSEVEKVIETKPNTKNSAAHVNDINASAPLVYRKGSNLRFIKTGELLTREDFNDFATWDKYNRARSMRKWGNGLMVIGVPLLPLGILAVSDVVWSSETIFFPETIHLFGVVGTVIAGSALASGFGLNLLGTLKIKEIEKTYNQHPGYALGFGIQQHGVGFALNF